MTFKLAHGEHNEVLCDKLLKEGTHRDWVITTAFYSAIHFVDHKLFPLTHDSKLFDNISEIRKHLNTPSKHGARKEIISIYLPSQIANYDFLDKNCRNARYLNYVVNSKKASMAHQRLGQLKSECIK